MIIFGSRMYGKKNVVKGWGVCDNCSIYGENTSYNGRKFGHLYFIPIIPEGGRVRVLQECKRCDAGIHVPEKDVAAMISAMRDHTKTALSALKGGLREFELEGENIPAAAYLASTAFQFRVLDAEPQLKLLMAALEKRDLFYALHLVQGKNFEFEGNLPEAIKSFSKAGECQPNDSLVNFTLASAYVNAGDLKAARALYEKALDTPNDRLSALESLLGVYEGLQEFERLAQTYEECFALVPEFAANKKVFKHYKKMCKKAGRPPKVTR